MKKKIIALFFLAALLFSWPVLARAQGWNSAGGNLDKAVSGVGLQGNLSTSLGTIVKGALGLVGTLFLGLTVYAGILWMTAAGNEEKAGKAKQIITAAIIGLFITLSAYAITFLVTSRLGGGGATTAPAQTPPIDDSMPG